MGVAGLKMRVGRFCARVVGVVPAYPARHAARMESEIRGF
jgi:hypothetical protein